MIIYEWRAELNSWKWVTWPAVQTGDLENSVIDGSAVRDWPVPELLLLDPTAHAERGLADCLRHRCIYVRIISALAAKVLAPIIGEDASLLKNQCGFGEYSAVCVLKELDCIDFASSSIEYLPSGGIARVNTYGFIDSEVRQANVFRVKGLGGAVFVQEEFVRATETRSLTGFRFIERWSSKL